MRPNSIASSKNAYYNQSHILNSDILNPLGIFFPSSPLFPSHISYYQSPKNISNPNLYNSSDYINQPLLQNEFNSYNFQNYPYYNGEQSETPKMLINVEQNNELPGIKKSDEMDNINEHSQNSKKQTKSTISKYNKINNGIRIIPIVQNIVSTAELCCEIKLKHIALQVENTQYNPKKFTALIMRLKEPKTTALIFSNGKLICLGAKTEEDSIKACRKYAKIIKSLNYPVVFKNFRIQNIVGSCDVKFKIQLRKLYNYMVFFIGKVTYETEFFPGLIYQYLDKKEENKVKKANIVFLIFKSGKIVISGAKNTEQIYNSFEKVLPVLNKFKIQV